MTVPAVTDLFAETAIQILRDELLDAAVIFEQVPAGSPSDGRVMAQDPAPFEEVEIGLVVTITVGEAAQTTTTRPRPTTTTNNDDNNDNNDNNDDDNNNHLSTTTYPTIPPDTTVLPDDVALIVEARERASEENVVDLRVLVGVAYH